VAVVEVGFTIGVCGEMGCTVEMEASRWGTNWNIIGGSVTFHLPNRKSSNNGIEDTVLRDK
jgi:hypothetical protein